MDHDASAHRQVCFDVSQYSFGSASSSNNSSNSCSTGINSSQTMLTFAMWTGARARSRTRVSALMLPHRRGMRATFSLLFLFFFFSSTNLSEYVRNGSMSLSKLEQQQQSLHFQPKWYRCSTTYHAYQPMRTQCMYHGMIQQQYS